MDEVFTIKELRQKIGVSDSTITWWIRSGKLPATKIESFGKQIWIVTKTDIDNFLKDYKFYGGKKK